MSEGKIWWITGATSGIGAALAEASAQAGVKVILSGRNLSALTAIAERCSPGALVLPFEATDFENIPSLVDRAWEWAVSQGGPINGSSVSKNALNAQAKARGVSDDAIDNGMEPQVAARRILDAISAGQRELILAEGMEAEIARLRRSDPNALFDQMARLVADGYAKKMGA